MNSILKFKLQSPSFYFFKSNDNLFYFSPFLLFLFASLFYPLKEQSSEKKMN